ncbi:ABC-type spermidine/putrescine transport system permease subunit II [Xanthomonas arboricola]
MRASRSGRLLGGAVLALGFGFLYLPILLLMV